MPVAESKCMGSQEAMESQELSEETQKSLQGMRDNNSRQSKKRSGLASLALSLIHI